MLAFLLILSALAGGVDDARTAVMAQPEDPGAWVALGDAYRGAMRAKKARAAYQRALALDPGHVDAQVRIRELGGGTSRLERKAMRHPDDDELWGDLGDFYRESGRQEEAIAAYRYAAVLDPEDGEWQGRLTELLGPEEMLAAHAAGTQVMGDEQLGDLGDVLAARGEIEQACAMYAEASALDPGDGEWREKLAQNGCEGAPAPGLFGEGGLGLGSFGTVGSTASDLPEPARVLADTARAFALMGDGDQALAFFERALELAPTDEKLRSAVLVLGERSLVELLEDLVLREPESDELWGDLGDAYAAVSRKEDAVRAWRRAHDLDAEDDEWGYKLGLADPSQLLPDPKVESIRELLETK